MRETVGMLGLSHSVLRYWENEFTVLKPRKNRKGDRYFRPADIKNLQLIHHLLKVRKFTIEGAREYLKNQNKALDTFEMVQRLERIKHFLQELKENAGTL
jgi:DNA-binding transcriptional MerR regulator